VWKLKDKKSKPKRMSTEDFNAIYELIRNGSKAPEVKKVTGAEKGTQTYQEQ